MTASPQSTPAGATDSDSLDARVRGSQERLSRAKVPSPTLLVASSTGIDALVAALDGALEVDLGDGERLHSGSIDGTAIWITDLADDDAVTEPAWSRAFPIWLAAKAGARAVIHTCAGTALGDAAAGSIARISDHVNLSGRSPLTGLGESRLGPLFPDQTRVHHPKLGALTHRLAEPTGTRTFDAVAACTIGPALATPAEFRWYAAAGADVAVQGLADPMIASAHAGLHGVTLCAITDCADEQVDVATLVARTAQVAPTLDALVLELVRAAPGALPGDDDDAPWAPDAGAAQ